jgi:ribonuclease BN (tRNA processing enzyme)
MADGTPGLRFIGSGDAFGSGGRFQACIALEAAGSTALLDCGATSLVAMRQQDFDPNSVDVVLVTHLHGDHFGGLPFLILAGQFSRRTRPLVVAGPVGIAARLVEAMETLYPGSSTVERRFATRVVELVERERTPVGAMHVTAFPVMHASGAPAHAYRVEVAGRTIAYSGDTEWCDALVDAAAGADVFIAEAYTFEREVKFHLPFAALRANQARLVCERTVLTHMSGDMLERRGAVGDGYVCAEDGLVLRL